LNRLWAQTLALSCVLLIKETSAGFKRSKWLKKTIKLFIDKLEGVKNGKYGNVKCKLYWKLESCGVTLMERQPDRLYQKGSSSSSSAQTASEKAQRKTKALLVTRVNSDLVHLITECQTSKQIWDKLKERFERNTVGNKLFLKQKLFSSVKMKDSDSLDDHLRRMKKITN
jgi:hypothetical protein